MARSRVALSVSAATAIAVTLLLAFHLTQTIELPVRDAAMRLLPARPAASTLVVAIDESSLRERGPWPWPRAVLAQIIDRAADGGARGVVLDVLLAEPRDGDDVLARAMRRVPTIVISALDEHGQWLLPAPVIQAAGTAGHGNFELDHDGILRRLASTKQSGDRALTAVSVEAASLVTGAPVAVGRSIAPAFRTRPRSVPQISAEALLRSPALAERLRGKLVFAGPTALALGDRVLTPVAARHIPDPGVTVHAAATESLIRGEEIHDLPPIAGGLLAGVAAGAIVGVRRSRIAALAATAIIAIGGLLLLATSGVAIPFVVLLVCALGTLLATEGARMTEAVRHGAESSRVLAHELKTPLASMRNLSQLLGGFELTESERRRAASLLAAEAGKLESMVNVLLDLERLPLRDFQASSDVINLGALVGSRVEFLQGGTDRPLNMSASSPVFVRTDPALIERVVDNLVGNALKYTAAPSPVTITVDRRGGEAVLEVEDRGPGLMGAERARVFDRFFRGSSAAGTQGLGLGLSLVAEVARWHGGTVAVDDAPSGGSRFRVISPLAAAAARAGEM